MEEFVRSADARRSRWAAAGSGNSQPAVERRRKGDVADAVSSRRYTHVVCQGVRQVSGSQQGA